MEVLGWALLIGGSVVVGIAVQLDRYVPDARHRWMAGSVAAVVGAFAASEWLFPTTEPIWAGVALWPALIGGLVVAILVDVATVLTLEGVRHGAARHGRPVG